MGPLALLGKERETLNGNEKQRQKRAGKKSGKIECYKGGITKKIHSAKDCRGKHRKKLEDIN